MSAEIVEAVLAQLYTDPELRARFLAEGGRALAVTGLDAAELAAFERIDRDGLVLAAQSYARKRGRHRPQTTPAGRWRRWLGR